MILRMCSQRRQSKRSWNSAGRCNSKTGAQAVAVTVPSLGGQSVEDYAIDLANSWGIGQAEEDNGVLILIAVEERKLRVEVGLGLEGALPDGKTGRIMDEYMTPSLRQNDYSTGMLEGYKAVASQKLSGIRD